MLDHLRPVALLAAAVIPLSLVTACSSDPEPTEEATLEWIRDQDPVSAAKVTEKPDDGLDDTIEITLDDGTPDAEVGAFIDEFNEHFQHIPEPFIYRLRVDGFVAEFSQDKTVDWQGHSINESLARALWLRADGRATSYDDATGDAPYDRERIYAPAPEVPQLALDFDDYVRESEADLVRGVRIVSPDRTADISWTLRAPGEALNRPEIERLVNLQKQYPGATGRAADGSDVQAVFFAADDPKTLTFLADTFEEWGFAQDLIIGWGPVVSYGLSAFLRRVAEPADVRTIDALAQIDGLGPVLAGDAVLATDASAIRSALEVLRRHSAGITTVLYRADGRIDATPVIRTGPAHPAHWQQVVATVVSIPEVLFFGNPHDRPGRSPLSVGLDSDIGSDDLREVLTLAHEQAPSSSLHLAWGDYATPISDDQVIADLALDPDGTVTEPDPVVSGNDDEGAEDLEAEITALWPEIVAGS